MKSRNHSKVLVFQHSLLITFSFIVLLLHQQNLFVVGAASSQISTDVQLHHTCDGFNLGNRMSEIEIKSKKQEDEIGILKTLRAEDQKVINQLRNRVDQLDLTVNSASANKKILERQKRPFRLAPAKFHR